MPPRKTLALGTPLLEGSRLVTKPEDEGTALDETGTLLEETGTLLEGAGILLLDGTGLELGEFALEFEPEFEPESEPELEPELPGPSGAEVAPGVAV